MNSPARRAQRLLSWYPRSWRATHGEEFSALLEDSMSDRGFWPRRAFDVAIQGVRLRTADLGHRRSRGRRPSSADPGAVIATLSKARGRSPEANRLWIFGAVWVGSVGISALILFAIHSPDTAGVIAIVGAAAFAIESTTLLEEPTVASSDADEHRGVRRVPQRVGRLLALRVDVDRTLDTNVHAWNQLPPLLRELVDHRLTRRFGATQSLDPVAAGSRISSELSSFLTDQRPTDVVELERLVKEIQQL